MFDTRVSEDEQINRHGIVVSISRVSDLTLFIAIRNVDEWLKKTLRVVGTMNYLMSVNGKEDWISQDYDSTLSRVRC